MITADQRTTSRVLMLTADYPPTPWSGVGVAVGRLAEALERQRVRVTVLVGGPRARHLRTGSGRGPRVLPLPPTQFPVDPRSFDLIHLHSLPLAGLALELQRRFDLPLVYTVHTVIRDELEPSPQAAFWREVQDRVIAASRTVVFLCQADQQATIARNPNLETRTVVVPNGLSVPKATVIPMEGPPEEPILVFAGRFAASKGLDLLADIAPRILRTFSGSLVLAGGHGDTVGWRSVRRLMTTCSHRAKNLGWLERPVLDELFARCALVLVPSRYEPFGLVALEAMRMGAPVLAADVGGLRDVVSKGSGGRRVPGRDPRRWADQALAILHDERLRRSLKRRGPRHVRRHYGAAAMARRLCRECYAA